MLWLSILMFARPLAGDLPASAPPPAAERAELEARFAELDSEFRGIRSALAQAQNTPDAGVEPPDLRLEFIARMQPLSDAGHAPATAWILRHFASDPTDPRQVAAVKRDLYERLLPVHAGADWLTDSELDVLGSLAGDLSDLGSEATSAYARAIFDATPDGEFDRRLRALSLEADAIATIGCADRRQREQAVAIWRRELDANPRSSLAPYCANAIWRLRNLVIGETLPAFLAADVDGNEIGLGDYQGKVIVVGFFSFDRSGDRIRAAEMHKLALSLESEPVALVGVNQDPNETVFRKLWEENGLRFPCVFENGRQGRVASAWHLDRPLQNLVVDRYGKLRYVDLDRDALRRVAIELASDPYHSRR